MATAGIEVDEAVACVGMGHGEAVERLLAAVGEEERYRTVQVTADRLQFARTFRPTWAIVAGIATIWIALLGLLFFFVSTTEMFVATVESDHTGTRVRLSGRLTPALLGRIRSAMAGAGTPRDAGTPPASVGRPVTSAFDVASTPVAPTPVSPTAVGPRFPPPPPAGGGMVPGTSLGTGASIAPAPHTAVSKPPSAGLPPAWTGSPAIAGPPRRHRAGSAVLDDGRVIDVSPSIEIGRDPGGSGGVSVEDTHRSVSKTHLRVQAGDRGWVVTDLHSTNGVTVIGREGAEVTLAPGVPTDVAAGSTVRFGGRSLVLGPAGTSP